MKKQKIVALIPAAGKSSRLGLHKALMPHFNRPSVIHNGHLLARIKPYKFYVTLPLDLLVNTSLTVKLAEIGITCFPNYYPKLGYAGSIKTILLEQEQTIDGIIISPVDVPLFRNELLFSLMHVALIYRKEPCIAIPHFYLHPGHPIYFSSDFFDRLIGLKETETLRDVIKENAPFTHALFWADARILSNLNTKKDWNAANNHYEVKETVQIDSLNPSMRTGMAASKDAPALNFS